MCRAGAGAYTARMRVSLSRIASCLMLVAITAATPPVAAQDSAASEALFTRGVADMDAGRFEAGCPALAESYRLDPRAGTMFTLAECEARWGKLASSVAHYSDYLGLVDRMTAADKARHADRKGISEAKLKKLRPQVPQLSLVLPADAPGDMVVKRDGVVLKGASLGIPLPVDPGEHAISTQLPGGPEHVQKLTIGVGESKQVIVEFVLPRSTGAASAAPAPTATSSSATPAAAPSASGLRTWGYAAGGIGLAGVVLGSVTGLMSMNKKKTVDDNCDGPVCNQQGLSASEDGRTLANVSTVGFAVGIVGIAAGAILLIAAPRPKSTVSASLRLRPSVIVSPKGAAAGLGGAW